MEGKQNTELYPQRTQDKINSSDYPPLKDFSLEDYFKSLEKTLDFEGYLIFDTGIYLDLGSRQIEELLKDKKQFLYGNIEEMQKRNNEYTKRIIEIIRANKMLLTPNQVLIELSKNSGHTRNLALHINQFFPEERIMQSRFTSMILDYLDNQRMIINLLSSRNRRIGEVVRHSEKYRGFRTHLNEMLFDQNGAPHPSSEDRNAMSFFINLSLAKPSKLFSTDKDLKDLYDIIRISLDSLNQKLPERRIRLDYHNFYMAKDTLYGKIKRHMAFSSYLSDFPHSTIRA